MRRYEDLEVWQIAYQLVRDLYVDTRGFPRDEQYGLVAQIRRAAVSVPSNIAEGSRRWSPGEFRNQLSVASGSNAEVECLVRLSADLGFLDPDVAARRRTATGQVDRLLRALMLTLSPPQTLRRVKR